ncbi:MAG: hypothetical protein ACUVRF_08180 [Desulfotomaculales bacterium]
MKTMRPTQLIEDVVYRLNELIPTMQQVTEAAAILLQQGNCELGYRELHSLIEALQHFEKGLSLLQSMGSSSASTFSALKAELDKVYPAILAALEKQDHVLLADVLQYELAPILAAHRPKVVPTE